MTPRDIRATEAAFDVQHAEQVVAAAETVLATARRQLELARARRALLTAPETTW